MLIDTDVFSYLGRVGDAKGILYRPHVDGKVPAISFVTVGELLFGAAKRKWGKAKLDAQEAQIQKVVIVPYDIEVCRTYARLRVAIESAGRPVADNDLWIAACAVRHSIPLISNNRTHFEHIPELILISEAPRTQPLLPSSEATST